MSEKKTINFFIGDTEHTVNVDDVSPGTTLNVYLRDNAYLTGTKRMCGEGGCGVCTVVAEKTVNGKTQIMSVNSCLVSILSCDGWKINTVDSIGNPLIGYHEIQKVLSDNYGTQCGFCSPGMVMNMYALNESGPKTQKEIENSFGGNICRCTGYRPILNAFKTLASDADNKTADIEDIKLCCNKAGGCCKNISKKNTAKPFYLNLGDSQWRKVFNLADLLTTLKSAPDSYMLICGNTSKGVYGRDSSDLYIDVQDVSELTSYTISDTTLSIGGNVTLTQLMQICKENSSKTNFSFLSTIEQHLDLVATVQVRNIGSIAGNLMMKCQHKEFPSDIFLLLETFNATLSIVDVDANETLVSPLEFLKLDMNKKVIKNINLNALDDSYIFSTYKILPRAQNAHAMVNAGFLLKIENELVTSARIVYGAINPSFIHASATEQLLKGQNLYENETLQKVFESLSDEIVPDFISPDPSVIYRKNLAVSLFYKFVLKTCPSDLVGDKYRSGGSLLERPISQGSQEYTTIKENYPLTEPITKLEALAQTSGQAKYIFDAPTLPNEVFASFVTADIPAGSTILSVDASEALKLEGVVAYFDKNDIPGVNTFTPIDAAVFYIEEELFCSGKVQYCHQPIGLIVANDQFLAWSAAALVKYTYSAPKAKTYLNLKDIVNENVTSRITPVTTVKPTQKGNNVKQNISGEMYLGSQYHFHMELQNCKVVPNEDTIDMYPSSQWMDGTQIAAAAVLGLPASKINVKVKRLGGAFGGKMYRNGLISAATALAAHLLQVPVSMFLSFEQNMNIIGKRYPFYMKYEVDVDDSGVIQYLNSKMYSDFGVGANEPIDIYIIPGFQNGYDFSTWEYQTYTVKTDTPANCYTRAPGSLEAIGAIETIMEHIAYTLNLDPMDVKLANISSTTPKLPNYWNDFKTWASIDERKQAVTTFNQNNRWIKQGFAAVPMKWMLDVNLSYSTLVSIFHKDGTVAISHGGIEMGQGINTKVAQVCAYKLGIDLDKISVKPSYTFVSPNCLPTGGSLTSEAVCYAVIQACDDLLSKMEPVKKTMDNPTWVQLVQACYAKQIQLSSTGFFWGGAPGIQKYGIYGVSAATVEVDILTGKYQILQVDILEEVGDSMSPLIDIGQIEGAYVMGIGFYMIEELISDAEGKLLTNRTWTYKPPGAKDIPINFRVKFAENSQNPVGVLKSKATAEPPLCLSVAVPLAVRNALASARVEADANNTKWVPIDGPTTVEKTFLYSLNDHKQYVLN